MPKALVVYLIEGMLVLPVPLYCIYQELWGMGSGWLSGIGYVLAVPFLALYVGSFHGLAAPLYANGCCYYAVSFFLTACLCWLGLLWFEGSSVFYNGTWPLALGVSGVTGLLGLLPAWILR